MKLFKISAIIITLFTFACFVPSFVNQVYAYDILQNEINTVDSELKENIAENDIEIKEKSYENDDVNSTNNVIDSKENSTNNVSDSEKNYIRNEEVLANDSASNEIIKNNSKAKKIETQSSIPTTLYVPEANSSKNIGVMYDTHIQNIGWEKSLSKKDREQSGTTNLGLRLEALHIKLYGNSSKNINIKYQTHIQNIGWQGWKSNGELSGTTDLGLRMEAIKIQLESSDSYSVRYRVHIQNVGWQEWKIDGEVAGTTGQGLRLEAIQIEIIPKVKKALILIDTPRNNETLYGPTTINVSGWKMANISNTKIKAYIDSTEVQNIVYQKRNDVINAIDGYGTSIENPNPGYAFSINGTNLSSGTHKIKVVVLTSTNEKLAEETTTINIDRNLHIQYNSHVQNVGWQSYTIDGGLSGTQNMGLRMEAMHVKLLNASSNAKIKYRAHVQNIGWQNWVTNGTMMGTQDMGLRMEAIEIRLENMDKYTVEYQVHVQNIGWTDWYRDGETAGTTGQGLRIEAIRIRIVDKKTKRQYKGIDVSEHQHTIDWQKVKDDGIDFAIIRLGWIGNKENHTIDKQFERNYAECTRLGISVGAYVYSYCETTQATQSGTNWTLQHLNGKTLALPVFIDVEDKQIASLSKELVTNTCLTFCNTLSSTGIKAGVYANKDWLENNINANQLDSYDVWVAQWNSTCTYKGNYSMWQYADNGSVSGIYGNVDMNICYKKY